MMKREVLFSAGQMTIRRSLSLVGQMRFRTTTLFALGGVVVVALFFFLGLGAKPAHAATFTVNSTADPGNGTCDAAECTLREAITKANNNNNGSTVDVINFNINPNTDPGCFGTGDCNIVPNAPLPEISAPVTINGYSQPGSSPNTLATGSNAELKIRLIGFNAGASADGLTIGAPNVTVKGLTINSFFGEAGIKVGGLGDKGPSTTNTRIEGNFIGTDSTGLECKGNAQSGVYVLGTPSTVVGGTSAAARNVISCNVNYAGVTAQATNTRVQGNLIGTDKNGEYLGNHHFGVWLYYTKNAVVGGTTSGARNVISGNDEFGVFVEGSGSTNNTIEGNYIGTDMNGTFDLGNSDSGVLIKDAPNNVVGGTGSGARNVISGNGGYGVQLSGLGAFNNRIEGNFIGTDKNGTAKLGNYFAGVAVAFGTGNRILRNSIFGNGGLGIDLFGGTENAYGVTYNDTSPPPPDTDTGPNSLQNFPEITSAKLITKRVHHKRRQFTLITGTLKSTPKTTFTVQAFSSPEADASGYGEGKTFAGEQTDVSTNENGDASFSIQVAGSKAPVGSFVTATATSSDTSEFSLARQVG